MENDSEGGGRMGAGGEATEVDAGKGKKRDCEKG